MFPLLKGILKGPPRIYSVHSWIDRPELAIGILATATD